MKHLNFLSKSRWLLVPLMLLTFGIGQMWGDTKSFNKNDFSSTDKSETKAPITVTFDEVTINNQQIRFGSGKKMVVSAANGYSMSEISVATNSSETYISPLGNSVSTGTWSKVSNTNYRWTGSATSVTFTPNNACRITTVTVTYAASASCSNKVTITNSSTTNVDHGSFDVDKTGAQDACSPLSVTVTTNPDTHFHVASISASDPSTNGTAGTPVDNGDGTYTITYSANAKGNSTISVTYAEDTKHTLTFYNNGVATGQTVEVYDGLRFFDMWNEDNTLEWPELTSSAACHKTSTTFAGWTTENVGRTPVHTIDVDKIVDWWTEINDDMDVNALWATIPASATTTFAAADYSAENAPITKTKDNITLYYDAGSIYKTNTPYTFTITSGDHYFSVTASNKVLAKLETTCNDGTYCLYSVSDGTLSPNSSTASQTVTGINTYTVECYPKSNKQIRMQTCAVYCYDNYITECCTPLASINGSFFRYHFLGSFWDILDQPNSLTENR